LTEGLEHLIASDPAKVLEIAGRLPRETENVPSSGMNALERSALNALAERDPAAAMRYLEPILPSIDMNIAVQDAIRRFARTDPDAALAWLSSLGTAKSTYIRVVLRGIAQADFPRAFRAASAEQTSMESFELVELADALGGSGHARRALAALTEAAKYGRALGSIWRTLVKTLLRPLTPPSLKAAYRSRARRHRGHDVT
jgi:hypothetical protein